MPFAAIYVPDFPVEAMVRAEPELREQAVAVVEGTPPLVHVVAVNERAAQAGVEPGMTRLQAESMVDGPLDCARGRLWSMADRDSKSTREGALRQAQGRLCATRKCGTVRERSAEREVAAHAALLDCACGFSPRVEDTAADMVVLDLAGLERIFGPPAKMARDVARRCSEMGLEANVAVASNADTAALVARGLTGVTVIAEGKEAERLGELSVEILIAVDWGNALPVADDRVIGNPARISAFSKASTRGGACATSALEILETLERWGVRNLRALAALPEGALAERLGQEGLRLQKLARGQTRRPLVVAEPPLVFEEAAELEYPVDGLEPLAFLLNRMLEQLCARLAGRALATNELKLRLKLDRESDCRIEEFTDCRIEDDAGSAGNSTILKSDNSSIFERTLRLPVPMLDAKVFLKLLQLDLQAHPPQAPVTKVRLRAEPAEPRRAQNGLFVPEAPEAEKLSVTLARIARVVGMRVPSCEREQESASGTQEGSAERVGSPEMVDTHCPDAFRMKPFAAGEGARGTGNLRPIECSPGEAPGPTATKNAEGTALEGERAPTSSKASTREGACATPACAPTASPLTALRVFRPALAAVVTVREGKPAQVASGERPTMRGEVVWCAGPWRSSGEWWTEQAWRREEWDVAVRNEEGVALYRVYRDEIGGKWWVEGTYD